MHSGKIAERRGKFYGKLGSRQRKHVELARKEQAFQEEVAVNECVIVQKQSLDVEESVEICEEDDHGARRRLDSEGRFKEKDEIRKFTNSSTFPNLIGLPRSFGYDVSSPPKPK